MPFFNSLRYSGGIAALALALACSEQVSPAAPTQVLLTPIAVSTDAAVDVSALSDRDTTSAVSLSAPVAVTFTFAQEVALGRLKAYGAHGLSVEVEALGSFSLAGGNAWEKLDLPAAAKRKQWTVALSPQATLAAGLAELELWGVGSGSAPRDPQAWPTPPPPARS